VSRKAAAAEGGPVPPSSDFVNGKKSHFYLFKIALQNHSENEIIQQMQGSFGLTNTELTLVPLSLAVKMLYYFVFYWPAHQRRQVFLKSLI
jgi:hypothetical protein